MPASTGPASVTIRLQLSNVGNEALTPQREIERRRRETINDGINDLARLVPGGLEKMGKGALLRLASEYMADLAGKVERFDAELGRVEKEKQQLRVSWWCYVPLAVSVSFVQSIMGVLVLASLTALAFPLLGA